MYLFQRVPLHVLRSHLLPWLSLSDFARFDTAITSKLPRCAWLSLLEGATFAANTWICDSGAIDFLVRRKINLLAISLLNVSMRSILAISNSCKHLQSIALKSDVMEDALLVAIACACPNLKKITTDVPLNASRITNASLIALGENCPWLRMIEVSVSVITDDGLRVFARGCRQIYTLCIVVEDNRTTITNATLAAFSEHCSRLVNFIILGMELDVADNDISNFAQSFPQLQIFQIELHPAITDAAIIDLALNCRHLRHVFLWSNVITDMGAMAIAEYCQFLSVLSVDCPNISDVSLLAIAEYCRHMTSLSLYNVVNVTDAGVMKLARCSTLTRVELENCLSVSDAAITALAKLPNLVTIKLSNLPLITNESLLALDGIKFVVAENCPLITESGYTWHI